MWHDVRAHPKIGNLVARAVSVESKVTQISSCRMTLSAKRELHVHTDPAAVTSWCRERAKPGCVFVTPSASSRRNFLHKSAAERGVTLGVSAISRGRLLGTLESRAGLLRLPILPPTLERMLTLGAAREARVPLFDSESITPAGAIATISSVISKLRLNGISPRQYADTGGDSRVADAFSRFEKRRIELGICDRADQIARLLANGIPSLALVIEEPSFADRITYDLYSAAIQSSRSCAIGISELTGNGMASLVISRLTSLGFTYAISRAEGTLPRMTALGGAGAQDEVQLVARHMLALLRGNSSNGDVVEVQPSEILGIAPNSGYLEELHRACAAIGIPIASQRRISATDVPMVRALLTAFKAIANPSEDTPATGRALLCTPYVSLSLRRADQLNRYFITRGCGSLSDWARFAHKIESKRFQKLAEAIPSLSKRLTEPLAPRELAGIMTSLALDYGFLSSGRKKYLRSGDEEAVRLDQQGWNAVTDAIDEINGALALVGRRTITALEWLEALEAALAETSVRVEAKGTNGIHLTIVGAGMPQADHVFAVGWKEGIFPRRMREDAFLPDNVKRALNESGAMFRLAEDRVAEDADKRERIHKAARQTLTVSWPASDEDGSQQLPSFYMDDLGITERSRRSIGDPTWPIGLTTNRTETLSRATLLARHRSSNNIEEEADGVRQALAELTSAEKRAYDGGMHAPQVIKLPTAIVAECGTLAGTMSASQAKTFVHCLYRHFGEKRLSLQPLVVPALDQRLLGSIAHAVLAEAGRAGFTADGLESLFTVRWRRMLGEAFIPRDVIEEFERHMLFERLQEIVETERLWLSASRCQATHFELAFGQLGEQARVERDPASREDGLRIALPPGSATDEATMRGSIDRVDVVDIDGRRYGVAIDYKLGGGSSNRKEMDELADFQLPIYCEMLPQFRIEPVGAYFYGIGSGERHGVIREDFGNMLLPPEFDGKVTELSPDGFASYMGERQSALRQNIARLASGELVVHPRKDDCSYCELRPVCRIGTFAVGGAGGDE